MGSFHGSLVGCGVSLMGLSGKTLSPTLSQSPSPHLSPVVVWGTGGDGALVGFNEDNSCTDIDAGYYVYLGCSCWCFYWCDSRFFHSVQYWDKNISIYQ